jgi:hypothetical protein
VEPLEALEPPAASTSPSYCLLRTGISSAEARALLT